MAMKCRPPSRAGSSGSTGSAEVVAVTMTSVLDSTSAALGQATTVTAGACAARVATAIADKAVIADQPLGRVATPEEVAQAVTFCVLDAPASMPGAILDVNGASYLR